MFCRCELVNSDVLLYVSADKPIGWTHAAITYKLGPSGKMFFDGTDVTSSTVINSINSGYVADENIILGRRHTTLDKRYCSFDIDELIFFNEALRDGDIQTLANTQGN